MTDIAQDERSATVRDKAHQRESHNDGGSTAIQAAETFASTLRGIDRQARRAARTLPSDHERAAASTAFWAMVRKLEAYEAASTTGELAAVAENVRAVIGPWLLRSRYWNRSYVKPHGYPGDFRVLEWMYDLEGDPCEDVTQPAVVNVLDDLFGSVHSVRAVWHRRRWFAALIRSERSCSGAMLRVLDVASGGSRYLRDVMTRADGGDVEGVFVDQDPAAVAFVETWLPRPGSSTVCSPARHLRLAVEPQAADGFDVVLSTGLFDYLADDDAASLLADMVALTRLGGVTAICNFCPADASRVVKECISDWRLIYRTEQQVAALFPRSEAVELERSPDRGLIYAYARRS